MVKCLGALLFLLWAIPCIAQTDSIPSATEGFKQYKSLLQMSAGWNIPSGTYSKTGTPFTDGFATKYKHAGININVYYSHRLLNKMSVGGGVSFVRNAFDENAFNKTYLEKYQDTVRANKFLYEHFGFYAGLEYSFLSLKKLQLTGYMGFGANYTFKQPEDAGGIAVSPGPSPPVHYVGGYQEVGGSFRQLVMASLNLRYCFNDLYFTVTTGYFHSEFKYRVVERYYFIDPSKEFLNTNMPISNLSLSLGVGTFFR